MKFLSACEIPEDMKEPHASDYRRRLAFALHDPSTPERQRREIALLLNTPSGTKPYMALAALRKEK
jgi:hypothetical protein